MFTIPAMNGSKTLRHISLAALALIFISCAPRIPVRNISDPGEFARNLFRIAEEGGEREWETQLTADRQAMGKEYVARHFAAWKKNLQELEKTFGRPLAEVPFRLDKGRLEFEFDNKWYLLIHAAMENGALRVNQD